MKIVLISKCPWHIVGSGPSVRLQMVALVAEFLVPVRAVFALFDEVERAFQLVSGGLNVRQKEL